MQSVQEKYKNLQEYLKSLGSVAVSFSSGVDSTFLLAAAKETLGADHVIAVTASSCSCLLYTSRDCFIAQPDGYSKEAVADT